MKIFCKLFRRHKPKRAVFAGMNLISTCKHCGIGIYMNDRGKWLEQGRTVHRV